ncbi:hypothetical protein Gotur_002406, partial [Gossypium turneri]
QKYDFQSYKQLIEHRKYKFTNSKDKLERVEYLKLIEQDTTDSSSSSNSKITLETNLEDLKVTSYKSDEENTSTDEDENIDIPEPMDTEQTDP